MADFKNDPDQVPGTSEMLGSKMNAKNNYGQNGYSGSSSDLPGEHTVMDRAFGLAADPSPSAGDWQTRKVSGEGYKPAHGMKAPAEPAKVPDANLRRSRVQAAPGSFQR